MYRFVWDSEEEKLVRLLGGSLIMVCVGAMVSDGLKSKRLGLLLEASKDRHNSMEVNQNSVDKVDVEFNHEE